MTLTFEGTACTVKPEVRLASPMASELTAALVDGSEVEAAVMQKVLEPHVRAQLDSLADIRPKLG